MQRYNPKEIEPKWQAIWDETGVYTVDLQSPKPHYMAMGMFNYPSGAGIHIGHAMNYTIPDVKARFKRQQGFESYHPVGWDAFGLPAENFAIKSGVSPQQSMAKIIPDYHKQYKAMGWSNDWEKEIATHLPEYYKWTQWVFSEMYRNGLAYQDSRMQWWCEKDATVLANEQVIDGKCWRHDGPDDPLVEKKEIKQWFFKITDYADELLEAIDGLDWTDTVKLAQKNWIGKSKGAEITFAVEGGDEKLTVFTTRPDTLYGATFMVIAPEHPSVDMLTMDAHKAAVNAYKLTAAKKTEVERQESKDKTGEFTGSYAINPVSGEKMPIWVADYVLAGYGTGAIMAVPAHDERDHAFATQFSLPVCQVVAERVVDTSSPLRSDKELVPREVVCMAVKHPTEEKYLIARPASVNHWSVVMGGIEEGESVEEAARRELLEESGYTDIAGLSVAETVVAYEFFAEHKDENRIAYTHAVAIQLGSLDKQEVSAEEQAAQVLKWATLDEIRELGGSEKILEPIHRAEGKVRDMVHEGLLVNSGVYSGQSTERAREMMVADLATKGVALEKTNYRMRDWSVSRQRYWGAPIPVIHCDKCGNVLVPDEQLPVALPELDDFAPSGDGRSALARATDWLNVECPECGGPAERETDTLDTYICSSWYMYRFMDPHNQQQIFDPEVIKQWEPVNFYNGADHATAHLLYARFIGHFFKKLGLVNDPEPFKQFLFNGKVTASDGQMFSKSKGNGVDPLDIIEQGYGADALRTYLMFAAPLELWAKWDPQGVPGTYRFLNRIWNLVGEYGDTESSATSDEQQKAIRRSVHAMIRKMTEDIEANRYNTAIAASMTCVNELYKLKAESFAKSDAWREALTSIVACVAPFAPYIAEELWHQLGHSASVHRDTWPKYDEQYLVQDMVTLAVQINGKLRGTVEVPAGSDEVAAVEQAKTDPKIAANLDGKEIVKTIYVANKLLNFVVK